MATKVGILSDANYALNCKDYSAMPVGFANAHFVGNRPNPNLQGVKTPKYQRSAPKPSSVDVMAVNLARMQKTGDRFSSARNLLNLYNKELQSFRPPPVAVRPFEEDIENLYDFLFGGTADTLFEADEKLDILSRYTSKSEFVKDYFPLVSGPAPKIYRGNRGDQILKQTVSVAVDNADLPGRANYLARFYQVQKPVKQQIYSRLQKALRKEGVNTASYNLGSGADIPTLETNMDRLLEIVYSRGVVVDLDKVFMMPTFANLPPPSSPSRNVLELAREVSGGAGSSGAGPSTAASQAATVPEGIPLPPTSQTTTESRKK